MIEGISHEMLGKYISTRRKIHENLKTIYALSHLLGLFEKYSVDSDLEIDPVALGHIHQLINKDVLDIWEILDDFIYMIEACNCVENNIAG